MVSVRGCLAAFVVVVAVAGVLVAVPEPASAQTGQFSDVDEGAFYSDSVAGLGRLGVFAGTECEEGFCPGGVIDRKTVAVWVVRVLGGQEPPRVKASRFDDVDSTSFYAPFIERMADLGVTSGCGDGSGFCPDRAVTRAQMAAFLSRAYHLAAGPDPGFEDVSATHWAVADIARLAASKITVGCRDGSVFCADRDTTRGEMAVFLWRAENRREEPAVPVRVPTDGSAVTVPRGGSFTAAFDTVTVDAPAGALSAQAQVSLSETTVGTLAVPEGETLAAEPIALGITGAHIARPLEFRAGLDTTGLTATGVTPAWYSSELGSWVPLDVQDLEVGSGEVTFKMTLVDAETVIAATASTPVLLAPADTAAALILPVIVIGILVFAGATAGVAAVALTSEKIHETLKGFFGLVAEEPRCDTGPLPPWVRRVFDSDEARSRSDARLHVCGEASGENLRVRVVNNRNFGVELQPASGSEHVELPGGNNPEGALDIAIKEAAEEVIGSSYLWPLSQSEFTLPIQPGDWKGYLRPTGKTAVVTGIRIGLDMLKVALPAIEQANNATFVTCVRSLIEHANDSTFDAASRKEWTKLIQTGAACFDLDAATEAQLGETVTKALKSVKTALSWLSTIESAATWGLTLADAIEDLNKPDANITVSVQHQYRESTDRYTAVSTGQSLSCAIRTDGALICWGHQPDRRIPRYSGIDNPLFMAEGPYTYVNVIASPSSHYTDGVTALHADGRLDTWFCLFSFPSEDRLRTCPRGVPLESILVPPGSHYPDAPIQAWVAAVNRSNSVTSCTLRTDGAYRCNLAPILHGRYERFFGGGNPPFKAITAGGSHYCALGEGFITCFGRGSRPDWIQGDFKAIAAGHDTTCAIRTDDTLACWISYSRSHSLIELRDQAFKAIAAAGDHTCAIRTDDTLACWQVRRVELFREVNAPSGTFQDVSVGLWRHFCAIRSDGVVVCWGNDWWGQSTPP